MSAQPDDVPTWAELWDRYLSIGQPAHPEHHVTTEVAPGMWEPARPVEDTSWWHRWRARRACRRAGGHWWHLDPDGHGWDVYFCCACGAPGEGMPQDGGAG